MIEKDGRRTFIRLPFATIIGVKRYNSIFIYPPCAVTNRCKWVTACRMKYEMPNFMKHGKSLTSDVVLFIYFNQITAF